LHTNRLIKFSTLYRFTDKFAIVLQQQRKEAL
jgi:hypothetical protein